MTPQKRMMLGAGAIAAVAAVAGGFAWWGVYQPSLEEETARAEDLRMVPTGVDPIETIVLERMGEEPVTLARDPDGSWRLETPVRTLADRTEADGVASRLEELVAAGEVVPAREADDVLSTFGLERPRLAFTVTGAGRSHRIVLGDVSPFDGNVYARRDDGPVVLVAGSARFTVDRSAFDLREKRLFRFDDREVESIEVEWFEQSYRLDREGGDRWRVSGLVEDRADASEVNRILGTIRGLRAIEFPDAAMSARVDFDEPSARIVVGLQGGREQALLMAEHRDGDARRFFARDTGLADVVQVQGDAFRYLYKEPFELQHKNLLDFDRDAVRRVVFEIGDDRFAAERDETPDGWRIVEPEEAPAEPWRLTSLVHALSDLKATGFAVESVGDPESELADYGLDAPLKRIALEDAGGEVLAALAIGGLAGHGRLYATDAERRRVYEVPAVRVTRLPSSVDDLKPGD